MLLKIIGILKNEVKDAKRIARKINIKSLVIDFSIKISNNL